MDKYREYLSNSVVALGAVCIILLIAKFTYYVVML